MGSEHTRSKVPASLAQSAGFLLSRSARLLQERNELVLEPLKLSLRELGAMRIIDDEGPLTQQALGERHNIDRTTVVQIIDGLEKRDLLTRVTNEQDRRSNLLYLTPRGKKTLTAALKLVNKQQESFLAPLDQSERDAFFHSLNKLLQHNA